MDALNRIKFLEDRLHRLSEIGMALSTEKGADRLFEMILEEAKHITKADGRTLYSMNEEGDLSFEILRNDSMNTIMGGTSGVEIPIILSISGLTIRHRIKKMFQRTLLLQEKRSTSRMHMKKRDMILKGP